MENIYTPTTNTTTTTTAPPPLGLGARRKRGARLATDLDDDEAFLGNVCRDVDLVLQAGAAHVGSLNIWKSHTDRAKQQK